MIDVLIGFCFGFVTGIATLNVIACVIVGDDLRYRKKEWSYENEQTDRKND